MTPELDIYGIYVPTIGVLALACFFASALARRLLAMAGFYRLVWHRPLFDAALYFCLLGASALILNRIPL